MSKLSLSVFLNAYDDNASSNAPSRNPIKWARDLQSVIVDNPKSEDYTIAPGETRVLFSGTRTTNQDVTTQYSLTLKPLTTNTYVLSWVAGTKPDFRTPRVIGDNATTQVTVTLNGPVVTFTSTGGTLFSLGTVVVGDYATIGNLFNSSNQGTYQIISKTSTSFSVVNLSGVAEGPITLGAGFADQVQIYSAAGVQVGDTLVISSGFSPITWGSYDITAVYAESLEFYSTGLLPQESAVLNQIAIYSSAKSLVYLESDGKINVSINGLSFSTVEPFILSNCKNGTLSSGGVVGSSLNNAPGMMLLKSTIFSLSVTNNGIEPAHVFLAAVE